MLLTRPRLKGRQHAMFRWNIVKFNQTQVHSMHQRRGYCDDRPFRMAVIGSGPSGFYVSYKILSNIKNSRVDMYERLPVPYGLVRYGVAPDHTDVKKCQEKFDQIACSPRFSFVGNISIGEGAGSLPLRLLLPYYDAILFAYGASRDRKLGISGEDKVQGIYSAREFVGWYNGHPQYADLAPNLTNGEEAIIIGQGNVALDVARILLKSPDVLRSTDITENALENLRKSTVKRVRVIGRRGPIQAAYTIKEIRELTKMTSVLFNPILDSFLLDDSIIKRLPRASQRKMELLRKSSLSSAEISRLNFTEKSISLEFCMAPRSFKTKPMSKSHLGSIIFEKTSLIPNPYDLQAKSTGSGEMNELSTSMALVSIGYKCESLSGFHELGIPFNDNLGIIPSDHFGRIIYGDDPNHMSGMYCAGWVKKGPTGVIASTMEDAFLTAECIAHDWHSNLPFLSLPLNGETKNPKPGWDVIKEIAEKRGCRPVSWQDWQKIDKIERVNGRKKGKEREKFNKIEDMLAILD